MPLHWSITNIKGLLLGHRPHIFATIITPPENSYAASQQTEDAESMLV